jgi:hypothetical protein
MIEVKVQRKKQRSNVDESDLIPLSEAAKLSGRTIASIANMLNEGRLPWFEFPPLAATKRAQRFTSKAAVLELPQRGRGRPRSKK